MAIVRLRNINPLGRVDLPLIGRQGDVDGEGVGCLEPGEIFEGPEELLEQVGNYELAAKPSAKRAPAKRAPRKAASKPKAAAPAVAAPNEGDDVR